MATTKIALVTGGSRGLGKDMALSLAKKGIDVIITYLNNKDEAEKVVAEIEKSGRKAAAIKSDAGDIKAIDSFLKEVLETLNKHWNTNRFDFLVNNAGHGATVPFAQVTEETFDQLMNVHYKGVYFLTQKALLHLNDSGGIIFISSGTTRYVIPGYSVYSSMKGAIEVLSRSIAKEAGPRKIRANVVAPGPVATDFNNGGSRDIPERRAMLSSLTALGRVGEADDIGGVVAFLCTEEARWINGQRIEVTGGMNL